MYVRIVVIMLRSKLYDVRHIQYANCLSLHVFSRVCTYSLKYFVLWKLSEYAIIPKCVTNWTIPHMRNCPSKCALAMDACVHINIPCTYSSVQLCEHHY